MPAEDPVIIMQQVITTIAIITTNTTEVDQSLSQILIISIIILLNKIKVIIKLVYTLHNIRA